MLCRKCPISLRCLAGRLGFVALCPVCGITTVEHGSVPVRLRCEKRTEELYKGLVVQEGSGIVIWDPVGSTIGVSQCGKCTAVERQKAGWTYDARQLDLDEEPL